MMTSRDKNQLSLCWKTLAVQSVTQCRIKVSTGIAAHLQDTAVERYVAALQFHQKFTARLMLHRVIHEDRYPNLDSSSTDEFPQLGWGDAWSSNAARRNTSAARRCVLSWEPSVSPS